MNSAEIQKGVATNIDRYGKKHGIKMDLDFLLKKLFEEVGEFTNALLIHEGKARKKKLVSKNESRRMLQEEIADVIGMSIAIANKLDIDMEKSLLEKGWFRKE